MRILVILMLMSGFAFGQKPVKLYYNKYWQVVSDANYAAYYRIAHVDELGVPEGMTKTYFITGELESECQLRSMSYSNAEKDVAEGLCSWYYKNGRKSKEVNLLDNKFDGLLTKWYDNGSKYSEEEFSLGKRNGMLVLYHENGKIKFKAEYKNDRLTDGWVTECDGFERCQKVFREEFVSGEANYGWRDVNDKVFTIQSVAGVGLVMNNIGERDKSEKDIAEWIHLPLEVGYNFSIETVTRFVSGQNSGYGLVWGVMDWENYYYFYLSANGLYKIGAVSEGLVHEFVKWKSDAIIHRGASKNLIKINKVKDKVYFSINGKVVETLDFHPFRGNKVGFLTGCGNQVVYEKLVVKQDLYEDEIDPISLAYQGDRKPVEIVPVKTTSPLVDMVVDVERNIPVGQVRENAIGIVLGIEKYKSTSGATYADRDAEFVKEYFRQSIGIPQERIYYKTDQNVTKAEFEKIFGEGGWLDNRSDTTTEVFIYYVGHGVSSGDGSAYFMPYDCDPNYAHLAGYSVAKLYHDLEKIKAKNIVVILDACFVGQDREANVFLADARSLGIKPKQVSPSDKIAVLSAASSDQVSSAWPEKRHGLFTYYFLKGLQGAADKDQNKQITIGELGSYTTEKVNKQAGFIDKKQNPKLQTITPDLIIYSNR